jgi:hypothetical protein
MTNTECGSCGVRLNADGTVDALEGEPAEHYADCKATFTVEARDSSGELVEDIKCPTNIDRYGPAVAWMRQRRAMSGPRLAWKVVATP